MKAFTNITLGEVREAQIALSEMPNAVPAEFYPEHVNWEAIAEYIDEIWGNEYDIDDVDLIHENVWFNRKTGWIYILEVQEDDNGIEHLVIETLHA